MPVFKKLFYLGCLLCAFAIGFGLFGRALPARAAQPPGGALVYVRNEAHCTTPQTPPSEYPLPDTQPGCDAPQTLVVAGADGRIVREARLPARVSSYAISPNGVWMAYHTGEAGGCAPGETTKADLALNMLNIQTGETKLVTKLLRGDFPQNILELKQYDPNSADYVDFPLNICWTFTDGIRKMAWSSDSQHLAFAGEMDGPSSDLYVLDMPTQDIRRLSDGIENIRAMEWSPDNKWIMHASLLWEGARTSWNLHFAAADGSVIYSKGNGVFKGWLDTNTFLRGNCLANCWYDSELEKINFVTGKKASFLSKLQAGWATADPANRTLALVMLNSSASTTNQKTKPTTSVGLFDTFTLKYRKLALEPGFYSVGLVAKGDVRMAVWDGGNPNMPVQLVRRNGKLTQLPLNIKPYLDGISPDGKYIVVPETDGLFVYRLSDGALIRSVKLDVPQLPVKDDAKAGVRFFWADQNTTFVKVTQPGQDTSKLYALDFLNSQPQRVDNGVLSGEMVVK